MPKLKPDEHDFIEELYKKEYSALSDYAKTVMSGAWAAEDVVQDTFLMACTRVGMLMEHPKPGGWLLLTLKNNIRNYWRVRQNLTKNIVDVPLEEWLNYLSNDKTPEDDFDILYGDLVEHKEYDILKKFVIEGYSIGMIALEYGVSANTCRQRIFRAKKMLRKIYEEKS